MAIFSLLLITINSGYDFKNKVSSLKNVLLMYKLHAVK